MLYVTGLVLPEISFEEDVGRSTKNIGKQPYAGNVGFPPACFIAVVGAVGNSNQGSNLFLSVIFVQSSLFQLFGKTHGITSFEIYFNAALGCFNSKESIGLLSGGFGVQTCWMYAIECNMLPREIMLSCWAFSTKIERVLIIVYNILHFSIKYNICLVQLPFF